MFKWNNRFVVDRLVAGGAGAAGGRVAARIAGAAHGSRAPTPRPACPCQRYSAPPFKYLTFTIVISQRQELIISNNNKARVSAFG